MPRLILIDPQLEGWGGHNHSYAVAILRTASDQGHETHLAGHCRFSEPSRATAWKVWPVFRHVQLGGAAPGRALRIRRFVRDCKELFGRLGFTSGDVVFLPSLREHDFVALARFLREHDESRLPTWHVQFHFDLLDGRDPEEASGQTRLRRMRRLFTAALAGIPHHRVHLHGTTEQLAAQYDRMEVARFTYLPYPFSPDLELASDRVHDGPLRVTCAGSVRLEKGRLALTRLVRQLLPVLDGERRLQLVIQTDRKSLRQVLPGTLARRVEILPRPDPTRDWPVVPVDYPLSPEAYRDLIRQADIGLFLYDPCQYRARCSGVLVDMIAAGIPIIVPAGCWLADQIARGASGLTADDPERVPEQVQEIATHYPRYRRPAIEFAPRWRSEHAAAHTLEVLMRGAY